MYIVLTKSKLCVDHVSKQARQHSLQDDDRKRVENKTDDIR